MESDEMRSDWFGYQCKSGETLFYYNIKTGEHRWANGLTVSEKSIFRISINDLVPKPKDRCSIGTQTEDFGCIYGCSSIYADKEIVKRCTIINSSELNSTMTDSCHSSQSCDLQEDVSKCLVGNDNEKQESISSSKMTDSCHSTESCHLQEDASKCLEADHDEGHQPKSDCTISDTCQTKLLSVLEEMVSENVEGDVDYVIENCDDQPDAMVIDPNTLIATRNNGLESRELKNSKRLQSSLCEKKFKKRKTHSNHMSKVHDVSKSNSKTVVKDKRCNKSVGSRGKEIVRRVKDKNNKKRLRCKSGRKVKNTKYRLSTDIKDNTTKEKQKYSLPNRKLKRKKNLVENDAKENPNDCPHCNKVFFFKSYLDIHLRKHTGEKPYECSYCDKAFALKSTLECHVRAHTGEKPYKCSYCDKAFADKSNLMRHLRTHTGEKPYKCSYCDKAFTQKGGLSRHLRTHTGEKPHECSHCDKAFAEKGTLNRHLRTHR